MESLSRDERSFLKRLIEQSGYNFLDKGLEQGEDALLHKRLFRRMDAFEGKLCDWVECLLNLVVTLSGVQADVWPNP